MTETLVDSNVLLDVLTEDPAWFEWSAEALERLGDRSLLVINPLIYAEVSVRFTRIEEFDDAVPVEFVRRDPLPWQAGFLAGKCFSLYRTRGGGRRSPLPDFYIGAHAAVMGMTLLTRDASRYRSYFPTLDLVAPTG